MTERSDSILACADCARLAALLDSEFFEKLRWVVSAASHWSEIERSASAAASSAERDFRLSHDEQKRLDLARRTLGEDPRYWARLAITAHPLILQAYIDRDLTFGELIEMTNRTALGCTALQRVTLLGLAAATARDAIRKKARNRRPPPYPLALKYAAVAIVIALKELLALPLNSESGDSVLARAVEWISAMGLFAKPPSRKTVHEWYLARLKELGTAAPRGRPRKS